MEGKVIDNKPVPIEESAVLEKDLRDKAVQEIAGTGKGVTFADQTIVVTDNGKRVAYLLDGKFTGFKTFIGVMLAVDPKFTIVGLEILEHEEDPGLGAEIERDYFRNQFKGKTFEMLKDLDVVKEPLPDEYYQALEGNVEAADAAKILAKYGRSRYLCPDRRHHFQPLCEYRGQGDNQEIRLSSQYPGCRPCGTED